MAKKIINVVYNVDDKALLSTKKTVQDLEKETKDSEKEMLKLDKAIQKTGNDGGKSFLSLRNVLGAISFAAIGAGIVSLAKKILDLGIKQEMLNVAFTTFLGSAAKAKTVLADLTKFSIITPFTPDQVNNAAKTLLAFGLQSEELIPTLKMLGDVSSGTGKDLSEMAVIFGQIRSTGRLMGQDLLQLINAGFNPLQVIADKTGKSVIDLKKDMENGLITFDMVSDSFKSATSEGGLFFNLMEKQSATVGGKLSTIAGNIEEMEKAAFNASKGGLSDLLDILVAITSELAQTEEQILAEQGIDISVIEKIFGSTDKMALQHEETKEFLNDLTSLYKLAVSEIEKEGKDGIAMDFMTEQIRSAGELRGITISLADAQKTAARLYGVAIDAHNEKVKAQNKETLAAILARDAANKAILDAIEEAKRLRELKEAQDKLKKSIEERAKALERLRSVGRRLGSDIFEGGKEADERESKRQSDAITREIEQDADRAEVLKANNKDMEDEITRQAEEAANERIRIANEEAANREAAMQRTFDLAMQLGVAALESALMQREVDTQSITDKYDRELELAGDNDRAKEQIEAERDKKLKLAEERNKEIQKKNARTKILIDTAVAVIKTFSQFGYPAGIVPAGLMTALGLFSANQVRKYKKGEVNIEGPGTSTSDSIPAMISRGESVINAKATSNSPNLLEAINDRKIDDRILNQAVRNGGSVSTVFDDSGIIKAIEKNSVDYVTHGYSLMKVQGRRTALKKVIRSKVQGY